MSDLQINLGEQIKELGTRWDELNKLWEDPPGPTADDENDQRTQITYLMNQVNEKLLSLERIRVNKKATEVTIRGITDEEKKKMKNAMNDLHRVIQKAQTFNNVVVTLTTILNSADTVIAAAAV